MIPFNLEHSQAALARPPHIAPRAMATDHPHVILPKLWSMAKHAGPNILEGTVWPFVIFYVFLWTTNVWGALLAALAYSYLGVARKLISGKRVSGLLVITTITLTIRTILGLASGSVVVYFLQPSLAKVALAVGFVVSLWGKEPMLMKLARDFVPIPTDVLARPYVRRFFAHATVLWAVLLVVHSGLATYVLLNESVSFYMAFKTLLNIVVKGGAIGLSIVWFVRVARRNGLRVAFA